MNEKLLVKFRNSSRNVKDAIYWHHLPNSERYHNSKFDISIQHCKAPVLCRAGQQSHGGCNYWYTEDAFNKAILKYIVDNWDDIFPKVIDILKKEESDALVACQEFIDEMQSAINAAKLGDDL